MKAKTLVILTLFLAGTVSIAETRSTSPGKPGPVAPYRPGPYPPPPGLTPLPDNSCNGQVDLFTCTIALYGAERSGGPLFRTDATLGACRSPLPTGLDHEKTGGAAGMAVHLGESNLDAYLSVYYEHAFKKDASGKLTEAVQWVRVVGLLSKNGTALTPNDPPSPEETYSPFDPRSSWRKVPIKNGVPALRLRKTEYVETTSESAILKVSCSNYPALSNAGHIY